MASITGYGGVGEIGGNAFLIDDGKNRMFLDFGRRFGNDQGVERDGMMPGWGDYFDEYLQPRSFNRMSDLMALEVVPDLPDLYRIDLGGNTEAPNIDGVILSHAHADHAGLIPFLKPDIPIIASPGSRATLASLQTTGQGIENEFVDVLAKGIGRTKAGKVTVRPKFMDGPKRTFLTDKKQDLGAWDVQHFDVDHSIHGARGSIIQGDVTIAYTGDFRMHGHNPETSARFIKQAAGADILIAEGTNVHQDHKHDGNDKESDVEAEIEAAMDKAGNGFVGIAFPPRDLDRFYSIWNVARHCGRRLVISTKQAHMLDELRATGLELPDPKRDPHLGIHMRAKRKGLASHPGTARIFAADLSFEDVALDEDAYGKLLLSDYDTWERPYILSGNTVTSADIRQEKSGYILAISYWTITELLDIFPEAAGSRPGGLYIHSMTQPFNDEMLIGARKLERWLKAFNLTRINTHVSGHLSEEMLHWVIDEIDPKKLVPIHSMSPHITKDKFEARTGRKGILPQFGKAVQL